MSFVATDFERHRGTVVGNGHCVALVQQTSDAGHTSTWHAGGAVQGVSLPPGTCIATFDDDGSYGNHTDGRSHACIYLRDVEAGIEVFDQWVGHPASPRVIRDKNGAGLPVDDASRFAVIE